MTFTPQSGDVAYFTGCVEGGDPYRVAVTYRHATGGWHNSESGLRLDDDHPGLADLHLLVRDHHTVPDPGQDPGTATATGVNMRDIPVAHLGSVPLALFFEPEAIREHFEEDQDMNVFTDEQLAVVGMAALNDDTLYNTFHDTLKWAMEGVEPDPTDTDTDTTPETADVTDGTTEHEYLCTYEITSLIDDHDSVLGTGELLVNAHNHRDAINKASAWVRDNDYHYDERIDPRVTINDVTRKG